MTNPIRVLIVDDHELVRKGVSVLFAAMPDIELVGEATSGSEGIAEAVRLYPDVILMELLMSDMNGVEAVQRIHGQQPNSKILVHTSFAADEQISPALRAGAWGYLWKDSNPCHLLQAIRQTYVDEVHLDSSIPLNYHSYGQP